jgi:hypothetical protein
MIKFLFYRWFIIFSLLKYGKYHSVSHLLLTHHNTDIFLYNKEAQNIFTSYQICCNSTSHLRYTQEYKFRIENRF